MPTNRFRSNPHPQHVLRWNAIASHESAETQAAAIASSWFFDNGDGFGLYADNTPFPSFPSGVQYAGRSEDTTRSWYQWHETVKAGASVANHYQHPLLFGPRPGSGRTRHMLYKYPWAGGDRYHYTFVEVSTRYELSLPSPRFGIVQDVGTRPTFWVAIPYTPPDNLTWGTVLQNGLVWDFSKGQYHNFVHPHQQTGLPGASSPPGYPISAYTQSYLCFPLLYNSEGVSTYYFAFAKCTAGFTAHFTQGDLAAWQSGAAVWSIDEVTAFGYSDAVPIEGASGVLGEWCPAA